MVVKHPPWYGMFASTSADIESSNPHACSHIVVSVVVPSYLTVNVVVVVMLLYLFKMSSSACSGLDGKHSSVSPGWHKAL